MRTRICLCLVLTVMLCGVACAGDLEITASAEKAEVQLGEDVVLTVKIVNAGDKPAPLKEVFFGRGSLEFKLTQGLGNDSEKPLPFVYTRIAGSSYKPRQPEAITLEAGKAIITTVKIPALVSGKMRIEGKLWDQVLLEEVTVKVKSSKKRLGLEIETSAGKMEAVLYPHEAPNTVANMVRLARDGYFDGLTFHRICKGFMIQGGCPDGTGAGDPGFNLPAEFNAVKHERGILSMARSQHEDSAGSQFFVMDGQAPHLDNKYTVWGKLEDGYDTLQKLANTPVRMQGQEMSAPLETPAIKKISVTTIKVKK